MEFASPLEHIRHMEKSPPSDDLIPPGAFRTLESPLSAPRALLSKRKTSVNVLPLAYLIRKVPRLHARFNRLVMEALNSIGNAQIERKLELVLALLIAGREEDAAKISEEVQHHANTSQEIKEKITYKTGMAQVMAPVDEEEAEALSLEAFKIYEKLEDDQQQADVRGDVLKTMTQVATPRCIEKISKIVDDIENEQQKLGAIIRTASELSNRFVQHTRCPVDTHIINLGRRWLETVRRMSCSASKSYALGALACMLGQFGLDGAVDWARHHWKEDIPDSEARLQFLETIGNSAIASNNLSIVRKLLDAQEKAQVEAGVAGTKTVFRLKAEGYLGQTEQVSSLLDQLEMSLLKEYPTIASELSKFLFQQEEFQRAEQGLAQIQSVELRVKTLVESSALLLANGKEEKAIQVLERALDTVEKHAQDSDSLFWSLIIIVAVTCTYSVSLSSSQASSASWASQEGVPYVPYVPLEHFISRPEPTKPTDHLLKVQLGKSQHLKNLEIIPLFMPGGRSIEYLTMKEALEEGFLTVTEKDENGWSQYRLKVTNKGERPILLLSGEELVGGQQNRTLNTTILLKGNSETTVSVSCTEQGRSVLTGGFASSEIVIPYRIRAKLSHSVAQSLNGLQRLWADQGDIQDAIWHRIKEALTRTGIESPTRALADIYPYKADELNEYTEVFECIPNQNGLLAMINGEAVGLDIIPHELTYKKLHYKLVKSYALSAILHKDEMKVSEVPVSNTKAWFFLQRAEMCKEKVCESVEYGTAYQFEGKTVVGSALISEKEVVHMAFFRIPE